MRRLGFSFGIILFALIALDAIYGGKDPQIQRVETPSFQQVILIENPDAERVDLYLFFPFGEAKNPYAEGLAHYVEHLAWLGASQATENLSTKHSNAFTNSHITAYWLNAQNDKIQDALSSLLSVASPLDIDPKFALEERNIIQREYDYRVKENPYHDIYEAMNRTAYGAGGLARSVIGTPQGIAQFSLDDARQLHQKSHALASATLLVYGDITAGALRDELQALDLPRSRTLNSTALPIQLVQKESMRSKREVFSPDIAENTFFYRKLVNVPCAELVECVMLSKLSQSLLDTTLPGGLATPLRFDNFIARRFSVKLQLIDETTVEIIFSANPDQGASTQEIETVFNEHFQNILKNGVPKDSFSRIKKRLKDDLNGVLEVPEHNFKIALNQLFLNQATFSLEDQLEAIENINHDEINAFLNALQTEGRELSWHIYQKD